MIDYEKLHGKEVCLIVMALTGRYNSAGGSLNIEGILESETDSQVILKNAKTKIIGGGESNFETPELYINKNLLALMYPK